MRLSRYVALLFSDGSHETTFSGVDSLQTSSLCRGVRRLCTAWLGRSYPRRVDAWEGPTITGRRFCWPRMCCTTPRLGFYACGIQIGCMECMECIERHAFLLAKPSGASHIWNSIHSPLYCMFRSSGVHHGQNAFKYLQNISPIIPWLSFVISIILEGHFVLRVMHFICSYPTLAC